MQHTKTPSSARVSRPRTFRPQLETLEQRVVLTLNTPPIAVGDSVEAVENQAYIATPGSLLGNDTDADGDALAEVCECSTIQILKS